MKKISLLLLLSACCIAIASPVRSMLSAKEEIKGGEPWEPTAADYVQEGLAFHYDGIENVALGVHSDVLPIEYGYSQWANIAPAAAEYPYPTSLNVYEMTPTENSLWFTTGTAWAGWGHTFNTKQVPLANAQSLLADVFEYQNRTSVSQYNPTELTVELVTRQGNASALTGQCLAGYNERALYYCWGGGAARNTLRYGYTTGDFNSIQQRYAQIGTNTEGTRHYAFTLSSAASLAECWVNGDKELSVSNQTPSSFFLTMIALKRGNQVSTGVTEGEFFCLRIYNRVLSEEELEHNYLIDRRRFGL